MTPRIATENGNNVDTRSRASIQSKRFGNTYDKVQL
jgi:hypothetical protein